MRKYFLDKEEQYENKYKVHLMHQADSNCPFQPHPKNRIDLGVHFNGYGAILEARKHFKDATPCKYCSHDIEDA